MPQFRYVPPIDKIGVIGSQTVELGDGRDAIARCTWQPIPSVPGAYQLLWAEVAEHFEDVILPIDCPQEPRRRLEDRLEDRVVAMRMFVGVGGSIGHGRNTVHCGGESQGWPWRRLC